MSSHDDRYQDHFRPLGQRVRTQAHLDISINGKMYPPAPEPKHHWLYFTQIAFRRLQVQLLAAPRPPVSTFWSCGTSNGMDAIAAWETLRPRQMILTDIVPDILPGAQRNVQRNCTNLSPRNLFVYNGDLAEPILTHRHQVDVCYANLPTLPHNGTWQEIVAAGKSASYYPAELLRQAPAFVQDSLLELYHRFLMQCKQCLTKDGFVVCAIGGRLSWEPIRRLFVECGYKPSILVFDVKPQEQADLCLPEYSSFESDQRRFAYYVYDEAREALDRVIGGTEWQGDWEDFLLHVDQASFDRVHDEAMRKLAELRIDATEADKRYRTGMTTVAHVVYVVVGQLG